MGHDRAAEALMLEKLPLVFSDNDHMSEVDWLYFALWILVDSLNMLMSVNICRSILHRAVEARSRQRWVGSLALERVAVVVPCYLPNEKAIIFETIEHITSRLDYGGELVLHVVYNTPRPMEQVEARLAALHGTTHGAMRRRVFVHKVDGSSSKAENLNHVIGVVLDPAVERFVAIFDADHHPDAACLTTLMAFLLQHEVDCVQGSTYIRNRAWAAHASRRWGVPAQLLAWLLANFIDAEFFITYFVWMPAIELIGRTGFFGGSVALWRYDSLALYTFSTQMQTEDIDASARAVLGRQKIRFCPEARSGELSPANLRAFWRQRQRWAIGWDQVSLRYLRAISQSQLSCRQKAGLYYVFPGRWVACTIGLVAGIVHPIIAYVYRGYPWGPWLNGALLFGFFFYALSTLMMLSQTVYHRELQAWPFIVAFYFAGPAYVLWQFVLVVQSMVRILVGRDSGWVVTQRAAAGPGAAPAKSSLVVHAGNGELETPKSPEQRARADSAVDMIDISLYHYYAPDRTDSVPVGLDQLGGQNGAAETNGSGRYQRML